MDMPRPSDEHLRLHALGGDWEGEEILHALPPFQAAEGRAVGRFRSRVAAGGFFLVVDYTQSKDDAVVFEGHGVYGFDPTTGGYSMWWYDSMGSSPIACVPGRYADGTWTYETESALGHVRYVYQLRGPGEFTLSIDTTQDGKTWTPFLEGRYRRVVSADKSVAARRVVARPEGAIVEPRRRTKPMPEASTFSSSRTNGKVVEAGALKRTTRAPAGRAKK